VSWMAPLRHGVRGVHCVPEPFVLKFVPRVHDVHTRSDEMLGADDLVVEVVVEVVVVVVVVVCECKGQYF
jgi:hypothetical protein